MPVEIKVREAEFAAARAAAGYTTDYALARAMTVSRSTVCRVLDGQHRPGEAFIGGALHALSGHKFEDLFEVKVEQA